MAVAAFATRTYLPQLPKDPAYVTKPVLGRLGVFAAISRGRVLDWFRASRTYRSMDGLCSDIPAWLSILLDVPGRGGDRSDGKRFGQMQLCQIQLQTRIPQTHERGKRKYCRTQETLRKHDNELNHKITYMRRWQSTQWSS